jgi:hypothetical protein
VEKYPKPGSSAMLGDVSTSNRLDARFHASDDKAFLQRLDENAARKAELSGSRAKTSASVYFRAGKEREFLLKYLLEFDEAHFMLNNGSVSG